MKRYRVIQIEVPRPAVVRLTFDDEFAGELDLSAYLERGLLFAPLRDEAVFREVAVGDGGRSFGWRLDEPGREIDFGADSARADIETAMVEQRAERLRRRRVEAAE